jgi:hypothetical protein
MKELRVKELEKFEEGKKRYIFLTNFVNQYKEKMYLSGSSNWNAGRREEDEMNEPLTKKDL